MAKKSFSQKSSDNLYFHKDFHIALNFALEYLCEQFGEEAVKEYLVEFAKSYYAPLKKEMVKRGLAAIKEHYEQIYELEGAGFNINFEKDSLTIFLKASPAVLHIKSGKHMLSPLYVETVSTVNNEICRGTPYAFELISYDEETGGYTMRFYKKEEL